jgi:hypothetical protein
MTHVVSFLRKQESRLYPCEDREPVLSVIGFPRVKHGAGLVKPGMTIKANKSFLCANISIALYKTEIS